MSTSKKSAISPSAARLPRWYTPEEIAIMALTRGPKTPFGTPGGSSGVVFAPQASQGSVWRRYSVKWGFTGGMSVT